MTSQSNDQTHYWDSNLDPANLGAPTENTTRALQHEIDFARITPDVQQMLDRVCPLPLSPGNPPPKILDLGTGLGTAAVLLRERGADVIALDISHSRLASMRTATNSLLTQSSHTNPAAVPRKIFPIKARAEALPFRTATIDGACSRAVLIHTDIHRACDEIARALKPDAPVAFSEVMAHNPLVRLYRRTLAPREWQSITTYFTNPEINIVTHKFVSQSPQPATYPLPASETRYYQLAFLAFLFQYALPIRALFRIALTFLTALDNFISKIWPGYRHYAWFVLITGKNRQP